MEMRRGDILFFKKGGFYNGSPYEEARPAVVVSNDIGNQHSDSIEVVWLTTREKKPLPTHAKVMCRVPSTALKLKSL